MIFADMIQTADWKGEKHVPVIDAPDNVETGKPFEVTVAVGKEIPHPNTTEHFIAWIDLYFKPNNGKFAFHVGHVDFRAHGESVKGPNQGPVFTEPKAAFTLTLTQPGTLVATSLCNIHGLWESSRDIRVAG